MEEKREEEERGERERRGEQTGNSGTEYSQAAHLGPQLLLMGGHQKRKA